MDVKNAKEIINDVITNVGIKSFKVIVEQKKNGKVDLIFKIWKLGFKLNNKPSYHITEIKYRDVNWDIVDIETDFIKKPDITIWQAII